MKDYGVAIAGNAGRDGELRTTQGGTKLGSVSVATYTGKEKPPTWITVIGFDDLAEDVASMKKGQKVKAWGKLELREYEHKGERRQSLELTAWELNGFGAENGPKNGTEISKDDIPF